MEATVLEITAEVHRRLSRLMACEKFGSPPKRMQERSPRSVLIGPATKEQQAIALLYNQVIAAHIRQHREVRVPFGVNPDVPFDHFLNHVAQPMLFELLSWSVHRHYQLTDIDLYTLSFDADWNMYGQRRRQRRKKAASA